MKNIAIRENHLFAKAYAKGKRFSGRYVSVFILRDYAAEKLMRANPQKQYINRIGLSVSKKVGSAVQRNRSKRLIRAALQEVSKIENLQTGWLIVISPRPTIVSKNVKCSDIQSELKYAFRKLGLSKSIAHPTSTNTNPS